MSRNTTVPIPSSVNIIDREFFGGPDGHVVGSAGLWADDSDATYAELYVTCNPDVAVSDIATGIVRATEVTAQPEVISVSTWLRCQAVTSTGAESPMIAELRYLESPISSTAAAAAPTATTTWFEIPMPFGTLLDREQFLFGVNGGSLELDVRMTPTTDVGGLTYPGVRVFEAYLVVAVPFLSAPPCRLYPADTQGSVGGSVRQFPPSKSRQRSSRGIGYY